MKRPRGKFPQLTHNDLKLCTYLRMGLSTKEIAGLLNLPIRGVETGRYRLHRKIGIDAHTDLVAFPMSI